MLTVARWDRYRYLEERGLGAYGCKVGQVLISSSSFSASCRDNCCSDTYIITHHIKTLC